MTTADDTGSTSRGPTRVRAVLDLVRDGVLMLGPDDVVTYANPAAAERLGDSAAAVVGQSLYALLPELAETSIPTHLAALRERRGRVMLDEYMPVLGGWYEFEAWADAGDGDDGVPGVPGVEVTVFVREVTEHRRAEAAQELADRVDSAVAQTRTWAASASVVARELRVGLDYDVAEVWVHTPDHPLRLGAIDHAPGRPELAAYVAATTVADPGDGSDAVPDGAVAGSGVTAIADLSSSPFRRRADATAAGLRAALFARLAIDDGVVVVIGLLRARALGVDDSAAVLGRLHHHLATTLSRRRAHFEVEKFFELTREFVVMTALDGSVKRVNPAMIAGLGFSEEELRRASFASLVHPDDLDSATAALTDLVSGRVAIAELEDRIRSADGGYRWLAWSAQLFGDEGTVFATGRDITDERAERRVRESQNDILRAVVAGEPLADTLTSIVGVLEEQHPSLLGSILLLLPAPGGEPTAEGPDGATGPGVQAGRNGVLTLGAAPSIPAEFSAAIDGAAIGPRAGSCGTAAYRGETVVVSDIATDPLWDDYRDLALPHGLAACWSVPILGTDRHVLGTFAMYSRTPHEPSVAQLELVTDAAGLAGIAIERSRAVDALARSEERFRLLAEVITDAIWDWDIETGSRWRSDGFRSLFGYVPHETEPTDEWWSDRLHPDERDDVLADRQRALDGGGDLWRCAYRFRRADGSYADVMARGRIVRDGSGRPVRMIGGMSDVSERRDLERQYLRAQRVESLGTLAGGIAHDLNNSLMPILMATELLEDAALDADARDNVEVIATSARRSAEMVRNILTFARGIDSAVASLAVDDVVGGTVRLIRDTFPKNVELALTSGPTDLHVRGDATQLHQVVMNLALNARDAMPDGGVLSVGIDEVAYDRRTAALVQADPVGGTTDVSAGRYVRITVADTGHGISAAVRDRLFEPFFTTKSRAEGTGLGLPTSLAIVRGHGGGIAVTTEPGAGATFEVLIPLLAERSDRAPSTELLAASSAGGGGGRGGDAGDGTFVLVVDDEPVVRAVVRDVLERSGYRVLEADGGAVALGTFRARATEISAVITDIMMPLMDGTELVARLRAIAPDVPVVAMTGLDDTVRAEALAATGVNTVLGKPFDRAALLAALAEARAG